MNSQHRFVALVMRLALAVSLLVVFQGTSQAQYFGRNKVEYNHFHFKILKTPHFDIYFYPEEEHAAHITARLAERWYARHMVTLQDTLTGRQPLILYASHPQFEETNAIAGFLGQGTGGVTEPTKRRIVLPLAGPLAETDHVIGHELVHAFQFDITGKKAGGESANPAAEQMPLWLIEGMAEYLSLGPIDPFTAMWMRDAADTTLPSIKDLENPKYFPYRYGQAFLAFLGERWGTQSIGRLLRTADSTRDVAAALDSVYGLKPDSLAKLWHATLKASADSIRERTESPEQYARPLIRNEKNLSELNVSPVLSPDGKNLAFFSERSLFSIDLYLADATTGKVKRTILKTELDPHYQSLEFIESAGSWDPTGKEFAFTAASRGRPILTLLDVKTGKTVKEKRFPNLGEIFDPAWSPDGRFIAFSALTHGVSDLFIYDLQTDSLKQLTKDDFADLQPSWSPDGTRLAFATDRFSTVLSNYAIGNYRLAEYDLTTGAISPLPSFDQGKNINPQWSPDGKSIYFVSDRNGISNIYRLDVDRQQISQVTNLYTGVSGITALSPALSVAGKANKIAFSVYRQGGYSIYSADSTSVLAGFTPIPDWPGIDPRALAEPMHYGSTFLTMLRDPNLGAFPDSLESTKDYHTAFSLDGVGQTTLAAGADRFGTYLGGGLSLFWSDMLGNQNLATGLQLQSGGGFVNFGFLLGYFNTGSRLNWGGIAQQVPYVTGGYTSGYGYANSEPAYIEQTYIVRQLFRNVSAIFSYPFSEVMRTDFSVGFQNISFDSRVQTLATSLNTGQVILNQTKDLGGPPPLNIATGSLALVYDNSYFGATSPILGERYRLEVDPNIGSIDWLELLGDYRRYEMPLRPFTIAMRVLHYGRYGGSADDPRLYPLSISYPGLVRGYETTGLNSDPSVSRLYGSKIVVANLELRFPLFGVLGLGEGYYGFFPVEVAPFVDAGVAWSGTDKLWLFGGDRKPVRSYGVAMRVNLFGYLVGEVDYVKPLDLSNKAWTFQFDIIEGF